MRWTWIEGDSPEVAWKHYFAAILKHCIVVNLSQMAAIVCCQATSGEPPSIQVHLIALMKSILVIKDFW